MVLFCHLGADAFDVVDEGAQVCTEIVASAHHRQLAQRIMQGAGHVFRIPVILAKEVECGGFGKVYQRAGIGGLPPGLDWDWPGEEVVQESVVGREEHDNAFADWRLL
uniref:Protein kinase domain-containing protein n=1 Tax=Globodera pallida TaxID=36090 RepID=A0A183BWV9_GLOPA